MAAVRFLRELRRRHVFRVAAGHAVVGGPPNRVVRPAPAARRRGQAQTRHAARAQARPDDADLHLALGLTFAVLGRREAATAEARRAMEFVPGGRDAVTGPAVMGFAARIYGLVGAKQEAVALLRQVLALPAGFVAAAASLKFDPSWDPLRGDPQFEALLENASGKGDPHG